MKILLKYLIHIIVLTVLSSTCVLLLAQSDSSKNGSIDDIRTPPSPAFVLLGIEPSSVELPTTPRALGLSLLSATNQGDIIPRNYALEFAPYWLVPEHRELTFEEYYHPNIAQSLSQTFSVSLISAKQTGIDSLLSGSDVALGIRTQLLSGEPSARLDSLDDSLGIAQKEYGFLYHHFRTNIIPEDSILLQGYTHLKDSVEHGLSRDSLKLQEYARLKDSIYTVFCEDSTHLAQLNKTKTRLAQSMAAEDQHRVGWIVEMAGAIVEAFPHNTFGQESIRRWGIWVTPTYKLENPCIDFLVVARFIRDLDSSTNQNFFDGGFRLITHFSDLSFSAEYVSRSSFDVTVTSQTANSTSGTFSLKNTYRLT